MDKHFKVNKIVATNRPQALVYAAASNDYSESFIGELPDISEEEAGKRLEKMLWKSKTRPHCGPYEHPQITFAVGGYPHDVAMQLRTHRVGITFDVQSQRYTGKRILQVVGGELDVRDVFYFSPPGTYQNRTGSRVEMSDYQINQKYEQAYRACRVYANDLETGEPEEMARRSLPQGIRQNFYVSMTARTLMHLINVRSAKDVQLECRHCIEHMIEHFKIWMPSTAELTLARFYVKGQLSP